MDKLMISMEAFSLEAQEAVIRPDEHGYYNHPLAVMDCQSANGVTYDEAPFMKELMNEKALFATRMKQGQIYGEFPHPDRKAPISRIKSIDSNRISHHIKSIEIKQNNKGQKVVFGKIKPWGSYGNQLKESLDTPAINTAFSLRALCKHYYQNGKLRGHMLHLITFDNVLVPGFAEASKQAAFEELRVEDYIRDLIHTSSDQSQGAGVSLQSLTENDNVLKEFGVDVIDIKDICKGIVDFKTGRFFPDDKSRPKSLAHSLLRCLHKGV